MYYKSMWEELKAKIEKDLEYHKSGFMQSIGEACHGQLKCEEFLRYIKEIEEKYTIRKGE